MSRRSVLGVACVCFLPLPGCSDSAGGAGSPPGGSPVASRSATKGVWDLEPELAWSLEPELRIGAVEGGGPDVFGRIRNLIPSDDGGVWVFDGQASELRRFDKDGNHAVSVGRQGQGPGEFSGNACAHPGANGEVWVETETNWHRFDPTGQLLGTFPTPSRIACAVRTWLPDGRYLAADGGFDWETKEMRSYFVIHKWTGDRLVAVDTVPGPEHPKPEMVTFVSPSGNSRSTDYLPFAHVPSARLEREGQFWVWDGGGAYDIRLQSLSGDTIRRVRRDYTPVQIDGEVRQRAIDAFQRPGWKPETDFDPSRVPSIYPPFSSARLAADETVWVERQAGDEQTIWEVFSADGGYLGAVRIPETLTGISMRDIATDHVWGIVRDELNVQYVVRARIVKPGG